MDASRAWATGLLVVHLFAGATSGAMALSGGAIAGISIGAVVFVLLHVPCLIWLWRWFRKWQQGILDREADHVTSGFTGWEMDPEEIKILKRPDGSDWELGAGNFGRVVKGSRDGVQDVAIKMTFRTDQAVQEEFSAEVDMMKFVSRDRNIVQFYGGAVSDARIWMVTEYMEGGDLRAALTKDSAANKLGWWGRGKPIALDIARGLHFLHRNSVTHRDLKSKNILLTRDGVAKIGDVGMAKMVAEGYMTNDNALGTFAWAAPEMLLGERCTEKVDIYSMGVVLWEIVTKEMPVRGAVREPRVPEECPAELVALIQDCMQRDPKKRPSVREVYQRLVACEPSISVEALPSDLHKPGYESNFNDSAEVEMVQKKMNDSAEGGDFAKPRALNDSAEKGDFVVNIPAQQQQGLLTAEQKAEAQIAQAYPPAGGPTGFNWDAAMAGDSFQEGLQAITTAAASAPGSAAGGSAKSATGYTPRGPPQ